MTYYLRINNQAIGAGTQEPLPGNRAKALYARCEANDPATCDLFVQISNMALINRKAALSALAKLIEVAASGRPLTEFYDKKQCHEIHSFKYKNKDRTIWRIWKGDVVRVTFYYGEGQAILLTHAFAKYEDKLSTAQKKVLELEVKKYIDALEAKTVEFIEKKIS